MKIISLYWFAGQQQLIHLDGKNLACFTWNLVQNLMNLVIFSKSNRNWQKMAKTDEVEKNANRRRLEAKG